MTFKRLIFLSIGIALIFPYPIYAQAQDTYLEEFTCHDFQFQFIEYKKSELKAQEGILNYKNRGPIPSYFLYTPVTIRDYDDFQIEAKIKMGGGQSKASYGLIFLGAKDEMFNIFKLNNKREFRIQFHQIGGFYNKTEWIPTKSVCRGWNTLKIERKGNQVSFFINGSCVHILQGNMYFGSQIGFYTASKMGLEIDYLKIISPCREINLVENWDQDIAKRKLPDFINSGSSETSPLVTSDGKKLYFNRYHHGKAFSLENNTDIFFCDKLPDGSWGYPIKIPSPVNDKYHNHVHGICDNGKTLLLGTRYFQRSHINMSQSGFSISKCENGRWHYPDNQVIKGYYNNSYEVSACWADEGNTIVYSVNRKDSKGEKDLYVSFYDKKRDTWTNPLNLGNNINTNGYEVTPYLTSDTKTLYFSSNGHPGYGHTDVFVSKRLDASWTNWSVPLNLGPKVNTKQWDAYYKISEHDSTVFMITTDSITGQADIFTFDQKKAFEIKPKAFVKVKLINGKTKTKEHALVYANNMMDKKYRNIQLNADYDESCYNIQLNVPGNYTIKAEKRGFHQVTAHINLESYNANDTLALQLEIMPLQAGNHICLDRIYFKKDKAEIINTSYRGLEKLARILDENPEISIRIEGHTDNLGSPKRMKKLSQSRACEIKKYLINKGISKKRLRAQGFGGKRPIEDNSKEETRKLNRRVEFIIEKNQR